jgi:hypothetical protein
MSVVSLDGLGYSGLAWTLKLLPSNHTETSVCLARPSTVHFRDMHVVSQDDKG